MNASEVGKTAYSMPLTKPGYPKGRQAGGQLKSIEWRPVGED